MTAHLSPLAIRTIAEKVPAVVPLLNENARRLLVKANDELAAIGAKYHDAITRSLITYFEGGPVTSPRNQFRQAAVEALGAAFDLGYGGTPDADALEWLNARVEEEFSHIAMLFEQAKELRKDEDADWTAWVNERADGYTATLNTLYNQGKLYAAKNKMLTFDGPDGRPDNICQRNRGTCVKLKGKRHRASWWIAHDLVPYRGNRNYDCGAWECQHALFDDDGNKFTI